MSEKKKGGFFKRLFNKITGSDKEPEAEVTPEVTPEVAPEVAPEAAPVEIAQEAIPQIEAPIEAPIEVKVEPPASKPKTKKAKVPRPAAKPKPKISKPAPVAKSKPAPAAKAEIKPAVKPEPKVAPKATPVVTPPTPAIEPAPKITAPPPVVEPKVDITPEPSLEPTPKPTAPTEQEKQPEQGPEQGPEKKSWFGRLKSGLSKSSNALTSGITGIFTKSKLDADTIQDLEDILIQADLGIDMAVRITDKVSKGRFDKEIDPQEVKQILADEVSAVLKPVEVPFTFDDSQKPFVILVVGVNGAGKTTTIGKLGAIAKDEGFSLTIAACDTFRAAAIEQLKVWGERIGAQVISKPTGAEAAGLAFDAHQQARENGSDILIIDTAGRLQNKSHLMDELEKIVRVLKKQDDGAPHAVLLVLDATTGQNAISQTEVFSKVAGVTGIIMTKLDGTARGGILVAIAEKFKLPIHAIGVGEQLEDFQPFDADAFARAIAGLEDEQ